MYQLIILKLVIRSIMITKTKLLSNFPKGICQAVLENKKKLKNLSNEELGMETNSKVFVNESLCKYYKLSWSQSLWNGKMIFAFWNTNGSLKLKFTQGGRVHIISHLEGLKELFPEYEFNIKDRN